MNLPKIVICCEFVVNDVKNVLFVVIGRELCPGLFFSDREETDPLSSAGGAREAEPVRIHGEPVRTFRRSPRTGSGREAGQSPEVRPGAWRRQKAGTWETALPAVIQSWTTDRQTGPEEAEAEKLVESAYSRTVFSVR